MVVQDHGGVSGGDVGVVVSGTAGVVVCGGYNDKWFFWTM